MSEHPAGADGPVDDGPRTGLPARPDDSGEDVGEDRGEDLGRDAGRDDERVEPDVAPAVQPAVGDDEQDELALARARLAQVVDLPVEEHAGVYEEVHGRLQEALAEAGREREPDGGAPDGPPSEPDRGAPDGPLGGPGRAEDDGSQDR